VKRFKKLRLRTELEEKNGDTSESKVTGKKKKFEGGLHQAQPPERGRKARLNELARREGGARRSHYRRVDE